jgi:hypothetical protein
MTLTDLGLMALAVLVFAVVGQWLVSVWGQMETRDSLPAADPEAQAIIDAHLNSLMRD